MGSKRVFIFLFTSYLLITILASYTESAKNAKPNPRDPHHRKQAEVEDEKEQEKTVEAAHNDAKKKVKPIEEKIQVHEDKPKHQVNKNKPHEVEKQKPDETNDTEKHETEKEEDKNDQDNDSNQEDHNTHKKKSPETGQGFKLSKHPSCAQEVAQLCSSLPKNNNFAILICLQDAAGQEDDQVTDECHQLLWEYKKNLTSSVMFDKAAFEVCDSTMAELKDCQGDFPPDGSLVNCLVEKRELVKNQKCRNFLNKMAAVVFSDYRLIKGFYKHCHADVKKHSCGKITSSNENDSHTQAEVIECLEDNLTDLSQECQAQIKKVAELSSDDYHMDRALFYACNDAREKFCADVQAGEGRIYNCLMSHKFEETMSENCKEKLTVRQKLTQENVKANHPLWEHCQKDFVTYNCKKGQTEHGQISHLLLCLNNAVAEGKEVDNQCQAEMQNAATQLFADYKLNPQIVASCEKELNDKCKSQLKAEGGALDCLMALGKEGKEGEGGEGGLTTECYTAVHDVLKETDAGNDFKIDRPLFFKCQSFIASVCKDKPESSVLPCLMDNIRSEGIPPDCQKELFHLQFFLARDFSLDDDLYRDCKDDAKNLCNAPDFSENLLTIPSGMVIACLYRGSSHDVKSEHKVSPKCAAHVKRVMHVRSKSVKLMPEIENPCRADISKYCLDKHQESQEIQCLQEKYEELEETCKDAIANFTELESEDIDLDQDLINACAPMVIHFCQHIVTAGNSDGVLPCLIENKHSNDMDIKCSASIEHWQILELKDVRFNHKLKKACEADIAQFCPNRPNKVAAVHCLSEKIKDSILKKSSRKVSEECREQVRQELMEEHEDIRLNPELENNCKEDLAKFCSDVWSKDKTEGQAKAEACLREKKHSLSNDCYSHLFKVEQEEVEDPSLDYELMHKCKPMIKKYCMSVLPKDFLRCLREHKNDIDMTPDCKKVIHERQKEGAEDVRLDPDIAEFCHDDVRKFCKGKDTQQRSEVLLCLKKQLPEKRLSEYCENFVRLREEESALDYRLDPNLEDACRDEVLKLCNHLKPGHGNVVDCLKENYKHIQAKACKTEIRRIIMEGIEDVHADPHLIQTCSMTVNKYCDHTLAKEGKVIGCLLEVYNSKTFNMERDCRSLLKKRMQLWSVTDTKIEFQSLSDIASGIHSSPNRHYLYTTMICILAVIFLGGLCFGRVSKRVKQEMKDR